MGVCFQCALLNLNWTVVNIIIIMISGCIQKLIATWLNTFRDCCTWREGGREGGRKGGS